MNTPKKHLRRGLIFLVLIGLLILPALAMAEEGDLKTISVVSTNDFHGALVGRVHSWSHGDVVGGAEYLAGYLNIVEMENPVLYLDAGDAMQGTLISNYFDGASTIEVFNAMGVSAMAIGNHEFDWGQEILQDRYDQADFKFLAANILMEYKGKFVKRPPWARPFTMKTVDDVRFGIIGAALPETPTVTNPIHVENLFFGEPAKFVNAVLPKVEYLDADVVVVLAHVGGYWPDFEEGIADLACGLDPDRVDLIISGHTHARIDDVICGIPVVQAYSSGTAFARVDFTLNGNDEIVNVEMNPYPVTTYQTYYGAPATYERWDTGELVEVVPDPEIAAIVDYYDGEIADLVNTVVGETLAPITRDYRHELVMGDWVTDIMRAYEYPPGIDFAFTNSGGLRADIDVGEITFGEIFEAQPFDNTLVVVELNGDEVRAVLEEGITGDHGMIQVSGLQFTFDYDAPVGSRIIGDVIDLSTGLPLDPGTEYNVAVNDFMANGGDEYFTLAANPQYNTYTLVRDIVVSWTGTYSPFLPPDPAVEQRVTTLGTPPS